MRTIALLLAGLLVGPAAAPAQPASLEARLLSVKGPIGPAVSDFIERGIERAAAEGSPVVILELDTPGGLDTSMRVIIKAIIAARLPVVTYVAPGGARAASAGTFILLASHVAAMAPATNVGAATPIPIGPGMLPGGEPGKERDTKPEDRSDDEPAPASPAQAMERKILNDAVAYIRGLARLRGRNAEWAEQAVRTGASLTAEDALEQGVIEILAEDREELVAKLDGRTVKVHGASLTLETRDWVIVAVVPDWRSELLAVLTNPNVAYLLMLLGIYGLLFEAYNPGAIIPGIVGAISLVLALYAFHVLPVNYAGLALILVGVGLIVAELLTPSFGALGAGGVVAFVAGSVILMDTDVEGYAVSMPLVITMGLAATALFCATAFLAARQRKRPVVTGREEMVGATAEALESFSADGTVFAHGEVWSARTRTPVAKGERVKIKNLDGLILEVEPTGEQEGAST